MKKTILTALTVIGLMTGAQAQQLGDNPTEFTNPFASMGAYNYVQKQSAGELNKWFLSGKNGKDKCFAIEKVLNGGKGWYSDQRLAKVINGKSGELEDMQLCMVYEIGDKFELSTNKFDNKVTITAAVRYIGDSSEVKCRVTIKGENDADNLVKGHASISNYSREDASFLLYEEKIVERADYLWGFFTYSVGVKDWKYLNIQIDFGDAVGAYCFGNINITCSNGKSRKVYSTDDYFNERLALIRFDSNGGSEVSSMFSLLEDTDPASIYDGKYFHMLNLSGEEIGCGLYASGNPEYIKWEDGCEPIPTRDGYRFMGWQLDGKDYDFRTDTLVYKTPGYDFLPHCSPLHSDMTLVAKWEQIGEGGGSTEPNPSVVTAINDEIAQTYYSNGVLRISGTYDVNVYNTSGVLVRAAHNVSELDLSELKSGLYIARVNGETVKFVK